MIVGEKVLQFPWSGGKTCKVKMKPSRKDAGACLGTEGKAFRRKSCAHETIDGIFLLDRRNWWKSGSDEGPVTFVAGSLLNPLPDQFLLFILEFLVSLRRRHDLIRVIGADAVMKFALLDLARNDGLVFQGILTDVEAEFCLSSFLIGPVARIALACQKRADFLVEVHRLKGQERDRREDEKSHHRSTVHSQTLRNPATFRS